MVQRLMWSLLRVAKLMIQMVLGNQTHPHVDSSSVLCLIGLLHLPPYSFIFIVLGTIATFFGGLRVN